MRGQPTVGIEMVHPLANLLDHRYRHRLRKLAERDQPQDTGYRVDAAQRDLAKIGSHKQITGKKGRPPNLTRTAATNFRQIDCQIEVFLKRCGSLPFLQALAMRDIPVIRRALDVVGSVCRQKQLAFLRYDSSQLYCLEGDL